jgi:hypothetical protein
MRLIFRKLRMQTMFDSSAGQEQGERNQPLLPDRLPMPRQLDPASALAYRTPLMEHCLSVDGKAAGLLTLLGVMCTVLAKFGGAISAIFTSQGSLKYALIALLVAFTGLSLMTLVQVFRTIAPRFPKAPPSLAFFGDIARMSREEYVQAVRQLDAQSAIEHILNYNHTTATICTEKFRQFRPALKLFPWIAGVWLALMILLSWQVFH